MMKRRQFGAGLVGSAISARIAGAASPGTAFAQAARGPRENTLMHVGGD